MISIHNDTLSIIRFYSPTMFASIASGQRYRGFLCLDWLVVPWDNRIMVSSVRFEIKGNRETPRQRPRNIVIVREVT